MLFVWRRNLSDAVLRRWNHTGLKAVRWYHELAFSGTGDPDKVLQYNRSDGAPHKLLQNYDVEVQMYHAPWNPADKNTVEGKYPSPFRHPPPQYPSIKGEDWKVAGSEGWGIVVSNQKKDSNLLPGTYVTMGYNGTGTYRSSLWLPEQALIPIERGEELANKLGHSAPLLFQLGGTALRMLNDFEQLDENDVVVQNAGNSAVGWMLSQLAAFKNIQVISLVRRGSKTEEEFSQLVAHLTQTHTSVTRVVAEEDLMENKDALKELQSTFEKDPPKLAIDAVGGPSADLLLKMLASGGTMVTYGGMSAKPVTVATPRLIFQDLKVRGYWQSRWMAQHFTKDKKKMVDDLVDGVLDDGILCPPAQTFPLSHVREALEFEAQQSHEVVRKKVVFDCRE